MCGDSHGIPATAAPSPDSGRGGKWSAAEVTLVSRVTCHVSRVSRAGVDHVEGDSVPDAGEAVPQELDEDGGDGELHVWDKQRHGDGARPPALRVVNISIFNIAKIFLDFTSLRAMLTC